jgi:hypothetical protein
MVSTDRRRAVRISQKNTRNDLVEPPPYISYKTFSGFLDRLHQKGVPNRIDRSFLAFLSGSNQSQLLAALRYLGLISPNGLGTDRLDALVKSVGAEYLTALSNVLKRSYPFLFNRFDLRRATLQEVEDKFSDAGASGDRLRKSIAFFLSAARAADIPTSPFITRMRRRRKSPSNADRELGVGERVSNLQSRDVKNSNVGAGGWAELLVAKFPQFDPTWPVEIKAKWFEAFQILMEKVGNKT